MRRCAVILCALPMLLVACDEPAASGLRAEPGADAGGDVADAASSLPDAGQSTLPDASPDAQAPAPDSGVAVPAIDAGPVVTDAYVPPAPCTALFYRDADGDGFGDPATALVSCSQPAGYVSDKADCYDANALAKPGQGGRFTTDRGDGSFDYNCDGASKPLYYKVAVVPDLTGVTCPPPPQQTEADACDYEAIIRPLSDATDGWYQTVAACGTRAPWGAGCELKWNDGPRTWTCKPYVFTPGVSDKTQLCN